MSKTLVINNIKREREEINDFSIYCIDEMETMLQLQSDMLETGYICDIFTAIELWEYYSDSKCSQFLGYSKGEFCENYKEIIDDAKYPVYCECSGIEEIDISTEDENKVKKQAKELYEFFNKNKYDLLSVDTEYESILQKIFDYTDYIKTE